MAGSYLGATTIGGSVPGLSAVLTVVGDALDDLSSVVEVQLGKLSDAANAVSSAALGLNGISGALALVVEAILAAKLAIRIPAVADFQAQLNAAIEIGLQLTADLTDPAAYLQALLNGLAQVSASLALALPTVQLGGQISASATIALALEAKILAIDLQLEALDSIAASIAAQAELIVQVQGALSAAASALLAIQVALSLALAAIASALAAYIAMAATLTTAGAYCFLVESDLQDVGTEFDAIWAASGLSGTTAVRVPIVAVRVSDTPAVTALNAVFKTS